MDLIQSFSVDHTRIVPGIFLSRVDSLVCGQISIFLGLYLGSLGLDISIKLNGR